MSELFLYNISTLITAAMMLTTQAESCYFLVVSASQSHYCFQDTRKSDTSSGRSPSMTRCHPRIYTCTPVECLMLRYLWCSLSQTYVLYLRCTHVCRRIHITKCDHVFVSQHMCPYFQGKTQASLLYMYFKSSSLHFPNLNKILSTSNPEPAVPILANLWLRHGYHGYCS